MKSNSKPRIGVVGLGSIAQKAYLPFISRQIDWSLVGAYSPTEARRNEICNWYRIKAFSNITDLFNQCDAILVHSSTASHFEVVSEALNHGKDVYVDKPLAANLDDAERLVELSNKTGRKLMVGFNRRFAPMYINAKNSAINPAWIRMEKHRIAKIGPSDFEFTILDDYIHLVDTARWLGEPDGNINGYIKLNQNNQLIYAFNDYNSLEDTHMFIGMHRSSGTNLEQLEIVGENSIIRVKNLETTEIEASGTIKTILSPSWETIIKRRGFEDCILHFIHSIIGDTKPSIDGEEALKTQKLADAIIQQLK